MNIAMVMPSQVDAYLDRATRFIESVNALKDKVNEMLAARTPASEQLIQITSEEPESAIAESVAAPTPEPVSTPISPVQNEIPIMETTAATETVESAGKKPEDIDLDAILSKISLGSELEP